MKNLIQKNKVLILSLFFLFTGVRYLILTPLNLNIYARFTHLLAFLFLFLLTAINYSQKNLIENKLTKKVAIVCFFAWLLPLVNFLFFNYSLFLDIIPNFSSTHFSLIFIPLLLLNYNQEEIKKLLHIFTLFVCIVGPAYFFIFYFVIYHLDYPAAELLQNFMGINAANLYGESYQLNTDNIRQIGYLMLHDRSGAGLTASFYYQFYFLMKNLKEKKISALKATLFSVYCILGIIYSTSLTVVVASFVIFFLVTFYHFGINWVFLFANIINISISLFIAFFNKGIWGRVANVYRVKEFYVQSFLPGPSGCIPKYLVWRPHSKDAITNLGAPCFFNEIFAFWPIVKYGLIPMIPWYIIFLSPLKYTFHLKKLNDTQLASLFLIWSFWICGLHFSGAEFWGNNFTFFLAWILIFTYKDVKEFA